MKRLNEAFVPERNGCPSAPDGIENRHPARLAGVRECRHGIEDDR